VDQSLRQLEQLDVDSLGKTRQGLSRPEPEVKGKAASSDYANNLYQIY